jgi:hypothetical protein
MNKVSKYLMSINRPPFVDGRQIAQATPCISYGNPAWFISCHNGYTTLENPVFTDEDGLNRATTIKEYAKNLGYYDYT